MYKNLARMKKLRCKSIGRLYRVKSRYYNYQQQWNCVFSEESSLAQSDKHLSKYENTHERNMFSDFFLRPFHSYKKKTNCLYLCYLSNKIGDNEKEDAIE